MAVISHSPLARPDAHLVQSTGRVESCQWALAVGDSAAPFNRPLHSDRSVQIAGTFGGGTIAIEGTIDGENWAVLTDPQGNALSGISSAKIEAICEIVRGIRPVLSGGDGSTALTITLIGRS